MDRNLFHFSVKPRNGVLHRMELNMLKNFINVKADIPPDVS